VTRQYELPAETAAEAGDEAVRRVAAAVRRGVGEAVAAAAGEGGAREDAGSGIQHQKSYVEIGNS
jgi:hypothetical protein